MKKFLVLLFLSCALQIGNAQVSTLAITYDTTAFKGKADYHLQNVDKTQIPTQILYDRVFPFARLDAFNQGRQDTSSHEHFIQTLFELRNASYSTTNVPPTNEVRAVITQQRLAGKVPIGIAHYQYNWIDTLALQNNLLREQGGLLYDVTGRPASPYKTRITTVAAALADSVPAGSVVFTLPAHLQLKNTTETLTNVEVNFGSGNPVVTLSPGGTTTVNYATTGDKIIRYLARFSNGTSQTTYSYIRVTPAENGAGSLNLTMRTLGIDPASLPCVVTNVRSAIAFQGYEETTATKGQGEVNTYYANCSDPTLRKPIIILDGFDPGNTRGASKIYSEYLSYKDNNRIDQNLVEDFQRQGYDIIILNFHTYEYGSRFTSTWAGPIPVYRDGGADYIERNAFVLVRLIDSVNAKLAANGSAEKLVIIGPSMGGLISRYALSYMERNGMQHKTRLWVSFDSPHNGANIPIGDQHFLEYYATKMGGATAKKALDEQIGSAAAKQMLLHHYLSNSELPAGAPNFRIRFQNALNAIGFPGLTPTPQNIRRIAITNGSGNGSRQVALGLNRNIVACEKMFTTEIKLSKGIRTLFFLSSYFFSPLAALAAPITISTSKAYFTPEATGRCLSFEGTFPINAGRKWYTNAFNGGMGLDEAPGGYFSTQKELEMQGANRKFFALAQIKFYSLIPNHNFIPTKSALAFTGANQDLGENLSGRNLVCTQETPFQSYFTPNANEDHIDLTQASVTWVTNEIISGPQQPTYISNIPNLYVSGPDRFCTSGSYSLAGGTIPSGTSITWSPGPIASIGSGQNTIQVQLNRISDGTATMSVALTKICGINQTVTRPYATGGFTNANYDVSGPDRSCNNTQVDYYITPYLSGVTSYNWTWPYDWTYVSGQGTSHLTLRTGNNSGNVELRVEPSCNQGGSPAYQYVGIYACLAAEYVVSPNPASSNVTVTPAAKATNTKATVAAITEVNIYDQKGILKKQQKFGKVKTATVNVSSLPIGTYFIEIVEGDKRVRQQLSILK